MSSTRIWRLVALVFLVFLFCVTYWADTQRIPGIFRALCAYPGGDKVGHFSLYGIFAFLGAKAWRRPFRLGRHPLPLGLLPSALMATLEETSQLFFSHRSPDFWDLGAGFLGIASAALLVARGPLRNR
jgi:VanZ family protein